MPTRVTPDDCLKGGQRAPEPGYAEVHQEILHRCVAIDRRDAIQPAFDALIGIVAVDRPIAERAKQIVLGYRRLSARDAVHIAVMEHHGIEQIMTFDSGFDGFPGITRLS